MTSYKPNQSMKTAANRALEWRKKYGRGGTAVGVARARDIKNGAELSESTVKRMHSFFSRHGNNKAKHYAKKMPDGGPTAWRVAWDLWGGNAGASWAKGIVNRLDERQEDIQMERHVINVEETEESFIVELAKEERAEESAEEVSADYDDERDHKAMTDDMEAEVIEADRDSEVKVEYRAMGMDKGPIDEEGRTAMIALSSEEPVERSFGNEVLEHSAEAIDLSFIASGRAPLLMDHDPKKQIGVVESVELDGESRRLRAKVRFGRNGLAAEAFSDVVDGIKANISVGYAINKMEKRDKDTYVAKSWRPVEASLVSLPADVTVGVGRSSEPSQPITVTENRSNPMTEQVIESVDVAAVQAEARKAEQRNAAQIVELGARHSKSDMAQKAISEGRSIEEFRGILLDEIKSTEGLESQSIGMTKNEVKRFSLVRAINALANPHDRRAQEEAAFEFECSRAASEQYGRTAQGVMLPSDVLRNWTRDINTSDDSNMLTEDFRGGDFIDVLRNQSSVMQAGARILNGLQSDVKIPKKATASSAAWLATEGANVAESEPTFSQISLSPKDLGAFTEVTRRMIQQSTLDIEALIRDDLAQSIATAMDLAALAGTGSSGQPTGIKTTSGINTVSFGAAVDLIPTFAQVVQMETEVAADNALQGNLAYILPASMYGALKTVEKAANTAQFVIEPGGTMNGYKAIVSNQCTAGDLYFGNFSDLLVGMWGGLDILVDPYTNSKSGTILIRAIQSMDVAVRHPVSFCLGQDA
jgi:HK97 family phage major capsid protein